MAAVPPSNSIITPKVPLSWVISSAVAIVFALGFNAYKVDAIVKSVDKLETRSESRDDKINTLAQSLIQQQSQTSRNTDDIVDIKRDVNQLKLDRWKK